MAFNSSFNILGQRVDFTTFEKATDKIIRMAQNGKGGYVCVSNVHMVMEGFDNPNFRSVVNNADLVTPDGMPLVWGLRLLGKKNAVRVSGTFLTNYICQRAEHLAIPIGFYGSTEKILFDIKKNLLNKYPFLKINYLFSPPYRTTTKDENKQIIKNIINSNIKILFVGLGCPKQELWMAKHKNDFKISMIGVGAVFDYISGNKKQAPLIIQKIGMEWFFRLINEPKRLWKRYFYHNPRFIIFFLMQLFGIKKIKIKQ